MMIRTLLLVLFLIGVYARAAVRGRFEPKMVLSAGVANGGLEIGNADDGAAVVVAAERKIRDAEARLTHSETAPSSVSQSRFVAESEHAVADSGADSSIAEVRASAAAGVRFEPITAISLTLKSLSFVMNQASEHLEAQTALKRQTSDQYVGRIASSLAIEGDKLSVAYKGLLVDIGSRVSDSIRDVAEAVIFDLCTVNAIAVADSVVFNDTEAVINKAVTFDSAKWFVSELKAALTKAKASGATDADKLELKKSLFRLVRMDIEMQTGPMSDPAYKPHIFKSMSPSLRAVSMGLLDDDSDVQPLEATEAKLSRTQLIMAYRDEILHVQADASAQIEDWRSSIPNVDPNEVATATGGVVEKGISAVQEIASKAQATIQGVEDDAENKLEQLKSAAISALDLGSTVAAVSEYMPLLGPSMSFAKATVRLVQAIRATRAMDFISARDTGTGVERAHVNARLATLNSCRMIQLLQTQLEAQVQLSSDKEALANFGLLGLPDALVNLMPASKKLALGRLLTASLCAVLNPVHHRINAIFRPYGVCGGGAVSRPPFSSHFRKVASKLSHEMREDNETALALSKKHAFMPHVDTCHDDDIYDAVLTKAQHEEAWKSWGYRPLVLSDGALSSSDASSRSGAAAEINGDVEEASQGLFFSAASGDMYTFGRPTKPEKSRIIMFLRCADLKAQMKVAGGPKLAFLSRLKVPLTDFRVISRARRDKKSVEVAGAEEEGLIAAGLRPLLLAGDPTAAAALSNSKSMRGFSALFPSLSAAADPSSMLPEEVQSADLRFGRDARRSAFFVYVARGGPAVITGLAFVPFTVTSAKSRAAIARLTWDASPRAGDPFTSIASIAAASSSDKDVAELVKALAKVDADTAHVLTSKSLAGKEDGSLVAMSKAVTYTSLAGPTTYKVKDLGVPSGFGCSVQTTPAWAWYTCPGTPPDCAKTPTPDDEERAGDMSRITRLKRFAMGTKTGKPKAGEGMVVHAFDTVCPAAGVTDAAVHSRMSAVQVMDDSLASKGLLRGAWIPTRTWERAVPSPWDDEQDNSDRVKLATMPYIWLQRRYAGPALQARDPLSCKPLRPGDALPPAGSIRSMTDSSCYVRMS